MRHFTLACKIENPRFVNPKGSTLEQCRHRFVQHGGRRETRVGSSAGTPMCIRDTSTQAYFTKFMFRCVSL